MKQDRMESMPVRLFLTVLTLLIMVMIYCFSMEPADASDRTSGRISEAVDRILYRDWDQMQENQKQIIFSNTQMVIRKCAHFSEFASLGLVGCLCLRSWFGKRKKNGLFAWIVGTLYAVTDELHQLSIDGRSGQWQDVLIDSAGVLTGVLIILLIIRSARKRRKTTKEKPSPDSDR